jgi:hypothetical protein
MTRREILRSFAGAPLVTSMPPFAPDVEAATISTCDHARSQILDGVPQTCGR